MHKKIKQMPKIMENFSIFSPEMKASLSRLF